jgi:hypothetical protein
MELHDILREIGAPDELSADVEEQESSFEEAWERCGRGDHRVWLAAAGGVPVELLIEAAAGAVLVTGEKLGEAAEVVLEAAELAVSRSVDELPEAIAACESVAGGGVGSYRGAHLLGLPHAARAAILVAHSAQGLTEGETRREAVRLDQAQRSAAMLGVGSSITLPAQAGPARLQSMLAARDPAQGSFLFAVAAAAEAVAECALAELGGSEEAKVRAEVEGALDRVVREVLEGGELG